MIAVAVTGIGVVSPIGTGAASFWQALSEGRSGIAPLEGWARPDGLPRVAAAVGEFGAAELIEAAHRRRMDRLSRMAVVASRLALRDAGAALDRLPAERAGVVFGTALGNLQESVAHLDRVFSRGPAAASPMLFPNLVMNAPAGYIAMELGCTGVNFTVAQAEVTGEHAVALGCEMVQSGRADVVFAGGGDELDPVLLEAYHRARALAGQRGGREWSSPYDVARSGIVLGEGTAVLVLEALGRARARGATVYAVIDDTVRFAVAAPRFDWPLRADAACEPVRQVLGGAGVDVVCGSANSSRRLDQCELSLFAQVLAERADAVTVTSIKGAIGEFGAAGALSVAAVCLALQAQAPPPLCHLETPEPTAALRLAPTRARPARLRRALVCGLARGGAGVALSLRAGNHLS
jgi:3-oxoacyl-[acyl-carrier-protein] synthase II